MLLLGAWWVVRELAPSGGVGVGCVKLQVEKMARHEKRSVMVWVFVVIRRAEGSLARHD